MNNVHPPPTKDYNKIQSQGEAFSVESAGRNKLVLAQTIIVRQRGGGRGR